MRYHCIQTAAIRPKSPCLCNADVCIPSVLFDLFPDVLCVSIVCCCFCIKGVLRLQVLRAVAERMRLRHPNLTTIMGVSAEAVTEDPVLVRLHCN